MRRGAMLWVLASVLAASGCGGAKRETSRTAPTTTAAAATGLRVGVVGPLRIDVPGISNTYASK